jgi:hypothetical protein
MITGALHFSLTASVISLYPGIKLVLSSEFAPSIFLMDIPTYFGLNSVTLLLRPGNIILVA